METSTASPLIYRSYSRRRPDGSRESWDEICNRTNAALVELGKLPDNLGLDILRLQLLKQVMPSGRWMWIGGTAWADKPENVYGAYNCASITIKCWADFGLLMNLAMQGTGTGAILEDNIRQLPSIRNRLQIVFDGEIGKAPAQFRREKTNLFMAAVDRVCITVGDSREGWVDAYRLLLDLASDDKLSDEIHVTVDLSSVRPAGTPLKGFGGTANPGRLPTMFTRVAEIIGGAIGRQLTAVECCLLIDEAAACVVAGNIRRSAGMRQGSSDDQEFAVAKDNLWQQDGEGNWSIDPKRDALRMANHTRVYHKKPTLTEVTDAVRKQFYSGEGAIQYAPEAIARANADLLYNQGWKTQFIRAYEAGKGREFLQAHFDPAMPERELSHRLGRYGLNPCFAAGTMVMTRQGHFPIESLVGQTVDVWDGNQWVTIDNFRVTGENQKVFTVTTHAGETITATDYHRFILADGTSKPLSELRTGDCLMRHDVIVEGTAEEPGAYLKGYSLTHMRVPVVIEPQEANPARHRLAASYNSLNASVSRPYSPKAVLEEWLINSATTFPMDSLNWTASSKADFVAGLFDSTGSQIDGHFGFSYYFVHPNKSWLTGLQLLLHTMGVNSGITADKDGAMCLTVYRHGAIALSNICRFEHLTNFGDRTVGYPDKTGGNKVISVKFSHVAEEVYCCTVPTTHQFALSNSFVLGQCGEILGEDFLCNLSEVHLNTLDPTIDREQIEAFAAAGVIAATLLHQKFPHERQQYSRDIDPIVGVSFTGLFDFFVNAFGVDWLKWWEAGRSPNYPGAVRFIYRERQYLKRWRTAASNAVSDYCIKHGLRVPNRCTTVQPSGSKSLITGASPGWHPPKAQRYIRRMTFRKDDPIALACIDMGYSVIPSPSDKDSNGVLLNDPFDPRCTEWLVEFPVAVSWADLPGADQIVIEKFSALAQLDFYMQVQQHYATHNVSATIELREDEIEPLAEIIYDSIESGTGYISAALLARTDACFPRMPFEPIDKATYDNMMVWVQNRATQTDFHTALARHDNAAEELQGPAGCDSDKCTMPEKKPG